MPPEALAGTCSLFEESFLPFDPSSFLVDPSEKAVLDEGFLDVSMLVRCYILCLRGEIFLLLVSSMFTFLSMIFQV